MSSKSLILIIFLSIASGGYLLSLIPDGSNQESSNLNKKISEDANKLNQLSAQLASMQSQINSLQSQQIKEQVISELNNEAIFHPSDTRQGFYQLKTNMGYFLVTLDKLTKYADGYKATFLIGNPNDMTCNSTTFIIKWGASNDSLKQEIVNIDNKLLPGIWNKINIILSPAKAEDTAIISLAAVVLDIGLTPDFRKTTN